MKGMLLGAEQLDELIRSNSIESMVELLQKTSYKDQIGEAASLYRGSTMVEYAVTRNFAQITRKLIRIVPSTDRGAVEAMLLKWDLLNLKTIIHAKQSGKTYEQIKPYLIPVGGLSEQDFQRLMKIDIKDVFREFASTKLGRTMLSAHGYKHAQKVRDAFKSSIRNLETFLKGEALMDSSMYALIEMKLNATGSSGAGIISQVLKQEINAKNILIIQRLKKHGFGRAKILENIIPGGNLSQERINQLIDAKDIGDVLMITKSIFPSVNVSDATTLEELEMSLEKAVAAIKASAFHRSAFSFGTAIGYLMLKAEEMNNIRKIAKAKEFGMDEQETRKLLIITG
jgi:V/A-type H+-transporting ATPase subunit C